MGEKIGLKVKHLNTNWSVLLQKYIFTYRTTTYMYYWNTRTHILTCFLCMFSTFITKKHFAFYNILKLQNKLTDEE